MPRVARHALALTQRHLTQRKDPAPNLLVRCPPFAPSPLCVETKKAQVLPPPPTHTHPPHTLPRFARSLAEDDLPSPTNAPPSDLAPVRNGYDVATHKVLEAERAQNELGFNPFKSNLPARK